MKVSKDFLSLNESKGTHFSLNHIERSVMCENQIELKTSGELVQLMFDIKNIQKYRWETTVYKYSRKTVNDVLKLAYESYVHNDTSRFKDMAHFLKETADNLDWALHSYAYRILYDNE